MIYGYKIMNDNKRLSIAGLQQGVNYLILNSDKI